MLIAMILSLSDKAAERLLTIIGGATGGVVGGSSVDVPLGMPNFILLITWTQVFDIAITAALGAAVGWAVHFGLNWLKKKCKKPHK